jgi:hypothetical protein
MSAPAPCEYVVESLASDPIVVVGVPRVDLVAMSVPTLVEPAFNHLLTVMNLRWCHMLPALHVGLGDIPDSRSCWASIGIVKVQGRGSRLISASNVCWQCRWRSTVGIATIDVAIGSGARWSTALLVHGVLEQMAFTKWYKVTWREDVSGCLRSREHGEVVIVFHHR